MSQYFRVFMVLIALGVIQSVTPDLTSAQSECLVCEEETHTCGDVSANMSAYTPDVWELCDGESPSTQVLVHQFPIVSGDPCEGEDPDERCRACGNQSTCHALWDDEGCHEECGGIHFAMMLDQIETGVNEWNVSDLAMFVAQGDAVWAEGPEASLVVGSNCPNVEDVVIAMAPGLAEQLSVALRSISPPADIDR